MHISQLLTAFSYSINWNAFSYTVYKILFTALTFLLYNSLNAQDFSTWANINSLIFLVLLWLDLGLSKSIPRFIPIYAKNYPATITFLQRIIVAKLLIIFGTLPLFYYLLKIMIVSFSLNNLYSWFYIGSTILIMQGILNILRLIYHAHFWNKQFNLLATFILIIEMTSNIIFIVLNSQALLFKIFITKLLAAFITTLLAIILLIFKYKHKPTIQNKKINISATNRAFIKHSGVMWMNNSLKSLSERNFLVPLLTHTLGATSANLFKIANDAALLFYRIVIKTIGTNDTALLAHIETQKQNKKLLPIAFQKLTTKITALCLPLLGILVLLYFNGTLLFYNPFVFQSFFIITIGFLSEALLSPFERVLEVKRRYFLLTVAYVPYICMILFLITGKLIPWIGLLSFITLIHGVRLVSSFLMFIFTHYIYKLTFPLMYLVRLACVVVPIGVSINYVFSYHEVVSFFTDLIYVFSFK